MLLPRTRAPVRAVLAASRTAHAAPAAASFNVLDVLRASIAASSTPTLTFVRHASHQEQGRANGVKHNAGRRLGAKKTGEQYVVPGNIIFRQRGTLWFPGENCAMGRDHTIHAAASGYVKYYRDPAKHPKRRYIGVVFERNQTLPSPPHAARRRRLGMLAVPRKEETAGFSAVAADPVPGKEERAMRAVPKSKRWRLPASELTLRPGYMYREANWQIGRAAERANVKVSPFVPGDRFKAWRKATARKAKNVEKRGLRKNKASAKKAKK